MTKNNAKRARKSTANARRRQYLSDLKTLEQRGIYSPTSKELTPWRKRQINKRMKEFRDFVGDDTFFIPVSKYGKKQQTEILQTAKNLQFKTTKKGILLPKEGHTKARIRKTKRGKYEIYEEGKTKRGENKGKRYYNIIPLEPIDELVKEKDRLREIAKRLGAPFSPKSKDRLYFKIVDQFGEGISNSIFNNIESLLEYLGRYIRSDAARLFMYRHIVIEKTTVQEFRSFRAPGKNSRRRGKDK